MCLFPASECIIHCLARRIVDFETHAKYLHHRSQVINADLGTVEIVKSVQENTSTEKDFIEAIEALSNEVYHARMFETDLMRHLNPNYN